MPTCFNACWAAARLGVLVVAPDSKPMPAGNPTQPPRVNTTAMAAPSSTMVAAKPFNISPRARSEPKNPGPICRPSV